MKVFEKLKEIAVLSALFHDIGKSNIAFQNRLKKSLGGGDFYRHEYLSLKIFMLLVEGCETDYDWLNRLSLCAGETVFDSDFIKQSISAQVENMAFERADISSLPPLAQIVAWLVVTHHRLPPSLETEVDDKKKQLAKLSRSFRNNTAQDKAYIEDLYRGLASFNAWQKNPIVAKKDLERALQSTQFDKLIINSLSWRETVSQYALSALSNKQLFDGKNCLIKTTIDDPYLLHLTRLILILSDHNYSSLDDADFERRVASDGEYKAMYANSNADGSVRQSLDEHLVGVGLFTDRLASTLSKTLSALPALPRNEAPRLSVDTDIERFKWQNVAYSMAREHEQISRDKGFFCVNLASTGSGKTICNARIMRGLSEHSSTGSRFTTALGLRTLTLQTGESFRRDLNLTASQLAIMVGSEANTKLYYMNKRSDTNGSSHEDKDLGSESINISLNENIDSQIDTSKYEGLDTLLSNDKSKQMLLSPLLVCTIDHIIQASEGLHGGRNIAPALRLLSSDLILDEPDDFGVDDLFALSRLVFMAGLYSSRIVLSSATLTPSMIAFLFDAYWHGRNQHNKNNKLPFAGELSIPCMFVDEQDCRTDLCSNYTAMYEAFNSFATGRHSYLSQLPARRSAQIMPLTELSYDKDFPEMFYGSVAQSIVNEACQLHDRYNEVDSEFGKRVSVGLVRLTYTKSVIAIAKELVETISVPDDTHIHFCCYHSRNLLAMRNELESKLDILLSRSNPNNRFCDKPLVQEQLKVSNCQNHIFIVLATPIAEVGRDHDYDWAIIEPSSMRSIIQLSGRVWRHRPKLTVGEPNISIMQYNLRHFTNGNSRYGKSGVFIHSGFESDDNKPHSYDLSKLISEQELLKIDSRPRLVETELCKPAKSLAQLEHNRIQTTLNVNKVCLANSVWHKDSTMYGLCTDVFLLTKFRNSDDEELEYTITLDDNNSIDFYLKKDLQNNSRQEAKCQNHILMKHDFESRNNRVSFWLDAAIEDVAREMQRKNLNLSIDEILMNFFTVSLRDTLFSYHGFLGFY